MNSVTASKTSSDPHKPLRQKLSFVFRSHQQLHLKQEFLQFFRVPSTCFRSHVILVFRIRNSFGYPRLGITVKARCSSVERTRVKRVIREFFRHQPVALESYDYHFVVPSKASLSFPFTRKLSSTLKQDFLIKLKSPA